MTVSSSSFSTAYAMMQQTQQTQRSSTPSASELTSDIMEISDLDRDSLLSIDEVSLSDETFSNMDQDGDGSLSSKELETSFSDLLDSMSNQSTSPEELGDLLTKMGLDVPTPPQNNGNTQSTSSMASEIFSKNDLNEDGTLSVDELDISDELMSILDSDEDGSITEEELASGLRTLFDSVENGEKTKEEVGDELTSLGVPPPPPGSEARAGGGQSGDGGGSDESSSSEETYEAADLNEDGTVTSAEQAEYDAISGNITSSDDRTDYTMNLVSSFMDAMKNESESPDGIELSQFKSVMTMVNNEIQDDSTAQKLNAYVSNLDLGLQSA